MKIKEKPKPELQYKFLRVKEKTHKKLVEIKKRETKLSGTDTSFDAVINKVLYYSNLRKR